MTKVELEEGQRQAVAMALAHLAIERPGWDYMLGEIADKLEPGAVEGYDVGGGQVVVLPDTRRSGRELFDAFKALRPQAH